MSKVLVEGFRLAPQQERVWLLHQKDKSRAYRAQSAIRINGEIDARRLRRAVEDVVQRHEILRTGFQCLPGMTVPLQVIGEGRVIWTTISIDEWELDRLLNDASPLNFEGEEALYATLASVSSAKHFLVITLPALCVDVAGLQNLVREIVNSYGGSISGEAIQYADLSEWQNELLESAETESGRQYWRQQDLSSLASLKLRYQRPATDEVKEFAPRTFVTSIDADALQQLAARFETKAETCLFACWQALLWRLVGVPRITVGAAFAGRAYEELKDSPGLFAKYLPIQIEFDNDSHFAGVVAQLQKLTDEAAKWHESFSWDVVDSGAADYFPFAFEAIELTTPITVGGVEFSTYKQYACIDRFAVRLTSNAKTIEFHYDSSLFDATDIERLAGQFHRLLEGISNAPSARLRKIEIISAEERNQVLTGFNQTSAPQLDGHLIHRLFEEQVERTPDHVAIVFENETLTYRELNSRSNQLAHHLRSLNVGPDVVVGVMMDRSLDLLVALLGILKAGAAYLPLDPAYPQERLNFMLAQARSHVLVSAETFANETLSTRPVTNPQTEVSPDNLAYVIYTSGSTGVPKGVMISHRSICNRLLWMLPAFDFNEHDRFLQKTPFSFDASIWELFVPLFCGATLVIARPEGHQDATYMAHVIAEQQVTTLQLVPSMLRIFLDEPSLDQCRSLKRVFCGGEELPLELQQRFHDRLDAELHNLYGPTESSIDASHWFCGDVDPVATIGRPLPNVQIYLLDSHLEPVPIGVAGELHIGGIGLARGYQNRPELTAERFIANPFSNDPGTRLYKTGDLASFWPDGRIEYLGRLDNQIKIRGFRIELGEIEAVLTGHPAVREAIVIAGANRLTAYVIPHTVENTEVSAGELRRYLKERLPDYMVPSAFVFLEKFPLMANGKLDRLALPEPDSQRPDLESAFVAPRTPVEQVLATIWSEVLGVAGVVVVGAEDNFFELGGHSLVVTQVIARIREVFHVDLSLRTLFECPTIASLAARTETAIKSGLQLPDVTIERIARDGQLPLSYAQQRMWFLQQLEPESRAYNLSSAICLKGPLNVAALEKTLNAVIKRHETLRASFTVHDGQPVQFIAPELELHLPLIDVSDLPPDKRESETLALAADQARKPFDLAHAPLIRASLVRLDTEEHVALFTQHHIVSDAWSMDVFIREVGALYESFAAGRHAQLPDLEIQYADYAAWQRQWLSGETLDQLLSYWKSQLGDAPAVLELPADRPRPQVHSFRGASHNFELSSTLKEELDALNRREGVTMFMTLLAAFNTLLSRYSGQDDIVVGTPIANRNRREIESLIGFFVNTLALRTDLSGNPTFRELLARVREVALSGYLHQDMPFDRLVDELQPTRNLNRQPLFQVMIVHQSAQSATLELPGLSITSLETENETSQFDLILIIAEWPGGFGASFKYNTDIFDASTIARMAGHFQTLLEGIVANPEARVSNLPLLTIDEQYDLFVERNKTHVDFPANELVTHAFEAQVARTPDAIALTGKNQKLTYAELNSRANQLAHYLRARGVVPETPVGIYLERSPQLIVALLGVLKAGGAYVPLDTHAPKDRLAFVIEDTGAPLILAERSVDHLPDTTAPIVYVDSGWEEISRHPSSNPPNRSKPENLAYVLYTSGSTGKPKGVMCTHGGLMNYLHWSTREYRPLEGRGSPVHSPIGFDLTITSIYPALLTGRTVTLLPEEQGIDSLLATLRDNGEYSLVKITPSHLELLNHAASASEIQNWSRAFVIGGDALYADHIAFWRQHAPATRLINEYGPTETVVGCCVYEVPVEASFNGPVPIGKPIANTQLYVLDRGLQPAPAGVIGELYIGGAGVARGYIGRSDLTAEKFVPDPFSNESGARLYRTGDLVRYIADGNLEYLGRIDNQVKINGFRIELGEIEAVLNQHEAVREVCVVARAHDADKQLVAYLVTVLGQTPTVSELRKFLKDQLPEYMIPASFVFLDTMPLTNSGKIDRAKLPQASGERPKVDQEYVAPTTVVQQQIAAIWQEVLRLDKVGLYDNFFDLGANSLLMVRVRSKLLSDLGRDVAMLDLFKHTTIDSLAKFLSGEQEEDHSLQNSQDRGLARKESVNRLRQLRQERRAAQKRVGGTS
ncbi:MAG TPA: amino acid adenylation domain-containing protein [Pyrinomonadaceae bacterium]|nr:amino acid adenylation domain-containing protein [Pyrinomonadaceae bacterium]